MSPSRGSYSRFDDATLATGLGLVLVGLVVMGVFETLVGSAHFAEQVPGVGVVVVHASFSVRLRAYLIALGFLVLLAWSVARTSRAIVESRRAEQ